MSSLISYVSENCDVLLCSCCATNHKPAFRRWDQSQDYFLFPQQSAGHLLFLNMNLHNIFHLFQSKAKTARKEGSSQTRSQTVIKLIYAVLLRQNLTN